MPFTLSNIKEDLEDIGSRFEGAPDLEFRAATKALELEKAALSYQRAPPGYRFPYGHTHETQEEVYVVVRGSGRMKLDDEIVDLRNGTRCASRPERGEATRPGRTVSRFSSWARRILATIRAEMSTASAIGGLASRSARSRCYVRGAYSTLANGQSESSHSLTARQSGVSRCAWLSRTHESARAS